MTEVDYMSTEGIEAVTSIALESENIGIWMSSTPTGKREYFYKTFEYPEMGYRGFHYPSHVNPNFTEKMDQQARASMSKEAYEHEILAEFGTESRGVFNKTNLDKAAKDYLYSYRSLTDWEIERYRSYKYDMDSMVYAPRYDLDNKAPDAIRMIGVDWDKYGAATQIVVTEYDHFLKKIKVVERNEIPPSEYTFDNAVKRIIELNAIWDPKFIYVDAGSGEYQIETLRKYGESNPSTGLNRKIRRIQFSENLDIIDPVSGEVDKKQAKDFMINQTSLLIDRGQLAISAFDDEFYTQMTNYRVLGKTSSGRNVYSTEDHIIDSYMLSLLGFIQNYADLIKTIYQRQLSSKVHQVANNTTDIISKDLFAPIPGEKKSVVEKQDNQNWNMKKILGGTRSDRTFGSFARGGSRSSGFKRRTF